MLEEILTLLFDKIEAITLGIIIWIRTKKEKYKEKIKKSKKDKYTEKAQKYIEKAKKEAENEKNSGS